MNMMAVIQTTRMKLRRLAAEDRAEFVRVQEISRPAMARWSPKRPEGEALDDVFTEQFAKAERGYADGTEFRMVGILPDGRLAGFFNLFQIVRGAFHNAAASWGINAEVARQGLCTEAVTAMLDFAFAPEPLGLGLHRVQANIMPANAASLRVAEKAGFRREGLGKSYLKIAGQWEDHILCAKLAEEHVFVFLRP
jgi:ribosomal-protein-alanine N-acetyltransferase